jgi:hypothetical protein
MGCIQSVEWIMRHRKQEIDDRQPKQAKDFYLSGNKLYF